MIPDLVDGYLPVGGRFPCTEDEIEETFILTGVFATSYTRSVIWTDWQTARDLVQSVVPVQAVWIAGSFTSEAVDPNDIDVTFVLQGQAYEQLGEDDRLALWPFQFGSRGKAVHGLRVDAYTINWLPSEEPQPDQDRKYLPYRGYWDDWWLRRRVGQYEDGSIARRGYLEVRYAC